MKATTPGLYGYSILGVVFSTVASMTAGLLIYLEEDRIRRPSPILSIFWLGLVAGGIFKMRTDVLSDTAAGSFFLLFCIEFGLAIVIILLLLFPFEKGPYQPIGEKDDQNPELTANFFSMLSFWWLTPLMILGRRKTLVQSDLWPLNPSDESACLSRQFEEAWEIERQKKKYVVLLLNLLLSTSPQRSVIVSYPGHLWSGLLPWPLEGPFLRLP